MLKYAIVGTGNRAIRHLETLRNIKDAEVIAIYSRSKERADHFGNKYEINAFSNYQDFLEYKEIEVVDIATINSLHSEMGTQAARVGKHVIVEKPIATRVEDAAKLIETCKEHKVALSVIFQKRFEPSIIKVRDDILKGRIGRVFQGTVLLNWHRSKEYYESRPWINTEELSGGGVLINQAIHLIDILLWVMGPAKSIIGKAGNFQHNLNVEDSIIGLLNFQNNAFGIIQASTAVGKSLPDLIEFHGTKGSLLILGNDILTERFKAVSFKDKLSEFTKARFSTLHKGADSLKNQLQDITDAILLGHSPVVCGEEGIKSLEVVEALYLSNKTAQETHL